MPRRRQSYEDIMDVKLRATLKELGFKRKSHATYIREDPKVRRIFELELDHNVISADFTDGAGVFNHEMERIYDEVLKRHYIQYSGIRNHAHAGTSIMTLIEIERGWDYRTWQETHPPENGLFGDIIHRPPDVTKVVEHCSDRGYWTPVIADWRLEDEEWERQHRPHVEALGTYLEELFHRYILPWYETCDDPLSFARWYDRYESRGLTQILGAITAYGLAGEKDRAGELIRGRIEEAARSFEDVRQEVDDHYFRHGWRRWLFGREKSFDKDIDVDEETRALRGVLSEIESQARTLSKALDIPF